MWVRLPKKIQYLKKELIIADYLLLCIGNTINFTNYIYLIMAALSVLQEIVLDILQKHSEKTLFGGLRCLLRNKDIYDLIEPQMKPSSPDYLSVVLSILEQKGKIKKETSSIPGHQGRKRIITIL